MLYLWKREGVIRLQDSKVNCGPVSLANALEAMGHSRSVDELVKLCRTSATNGTSTRNLVRAIEHLKESCDLFDHEIIRTGDPSAASGLLLNALYQGRAAIAVVDAGNHYVSIVGTLGSSVMVVDPADERVLIPYTREEWVERWDSGGRFGYWAVVL